MALSLVQRLLHERYGLESTVKSKWAELDRQVSDGKLPALGVQLARHLGAVDESQALLVANLVKAAQEGHLCLSLDTEMPELRGVVRCGTRYYLQRLYNAEQRVVTALRKHLSVEPQRLKSVNAPNDRLLPEQKAAVECAQCKALTLIVGGPGTGKTFVAAQLLASLGLERVALAAPTGKAAGNLQRALGGKHKVQTLHALLGLPHRPVRQLRADLVLVDEAAMVDVKLLGMLLSAVKPGSRVVLMGDAAQLPPVESGGLFGELAQHPDLQPHVARLTKCVRTDRTELLGLASAVREGRGLEMLAQVERVPWGEASEIVAAARAGTRVLTALRRGPWGAEALNDLVLAGVTQARRPIVMTRNDYRLGLYNGDEGVLEGEVATFGTREVSAHSLSAYQLAYCLSVHKSQGSEFDRVLLVAPPGSETFGRELFYTALTRAKEHFAVCAPDEVLESMLGRHSARQSGIGSFALKD